MASCLTLQPGMPCGGEVSSHPRDELKVMCCCRFGYTNPVNYNDNELYCGGFSVQWQDNGGKCGVCGDNWAAPRPREHEVGGRYGKGIIGRRYTMGQTIDVDIDISANHWGYFELKICPVDDAGSDPSQECFDSNPLVVADTGSDKFYVPLDSPKITKFQYQVGGVCVPASPS